MHSLVHCFCHFTCSSTNSDLTAPYPAHDFASKVWTYLHLPMFIFEYLLVESLNVWETGWRFCGTWLLKFYQLYLVFEAILAHLVGWTPECAKLNGDPVHFSNLKPLLSGILMFPNFWGKPFLYGHICELCDPNESRLLCTFNVPLRIYSFLFSLFLAVAG